MKSIPRLDLTTLGYIIMAGVLGTFAASTYVGLTGPSGSAVFPTGEAAQPPVGILDKLQRTFRAYGERG